MLEEGEEFDEKGFIQFMLTVTIITQIILLIFLHS